MILQGKEPGSLEGPKLCPYWSIKPTADLKSKDLWNRNTHKRYLLHHQVHDQHGAIWDTWFSFPTRITVRPFASLMSELITKMMGCFWVGVLVNPSIHEFLFSVCPSMGPRFPGSETIANFTYLGFTWFAFTYLQLGIREKTQCWRYLSAAGNQILSTLIP